MNSGISIRDYSQAQQTPWCFNTKTCDKPSVIIVGLDYYDIDVLFEKQDMFFERDISQTLYYLNSLLSCDCAQTMHKLQVELYQAMQHTPAVLHNELITVFELYKMLFNLIGEMLYYAGIEFGQDWYIYKIMDDKTLLIKRKDSNEDLNLSEPQPF